jgi:hypothetical protein
MSNLPYKNPISPLQVLGTTSVSRTDTFGTNFSVLGVGGFMEVYSLSDLDYTVPIGQTGTIEFTGNTIPIQFKKGSGSVFSPDVLTLNSDNISSGRRRLGMLVYVYETDKIYQFIIRNYDSLWSGATGSTGPGGPSVVISDFGTTVKNNTVAGQNFINAWTASTIEGVSGFTSANATWRILNFSGGSSSSTADTFVTGFTLVNNTINLTQNRTDQYSGFSISLSAYTGQSITGLYLPLSGGTVTGGTIFQSGLTANTISATTYFNLPVTADTFVTGFTYNNNSFTITDNRGTGFTATINTMTGLTATTISATTYQNLPVTADTFVTGFTFNTANYDLTIKQNNGVSDLTQSLSILASDLFVTGGTYNANTGVATFTNNTGGTFQVSGFLTGFTDTVITAFTYNNNSFTINDSRSSAFTATINTMTGLTATTISATTYQNLPVTADTFVTGFTLNNNLITLTQNRNDQFSGFSISLSAYTGGSSTIVSGLYLPLSGGTVTGGTIFQSGLTANTISATTYFNLPVTADTFTTAATYSLSTGIITFNRNNNTPNYTVTGLTGFTTAFTYSNNVFTISRSNATSLTALINTVTGFTINGNLSVTGTSTVNNITITGTTAMNGPITSSSLSGSTTRVLEVSSGGTVTATKEIITAYITSGGTAANLLENTSNWDINGVYTGTTITGTYQGQKHYNNNYFFEAVADNNFIRLIRG